ncbi:hypothetical protein EIN_254560 [Entamoeba invadens IP1]|uniref:Uncharacterized protein n=1 Tax=Entamoeba invadens IP1 TaxID=370355 RepID=A0A0A1UHC9_ENTIV|nr:hypothetical protein EIN_254560 [Entamoeba invadens IP1]ELP95102.1 hypothetical protein EIN_254560 [Entamoeba invadens IP1]|eukprot:XP_004261873.1 hypothetical protein EIN_254560 [Entamoeba invadens IP1]
MSDDSSEYFDFPLQKLVITAEYIVLAGLCLVQSIRIIKNHHKICGFQNVLVLLLMFWSIFRVVETMIAFLLIVLDVHENEINAMSPEEWLITEFVPKNYILSITNTTAIE